MKRFVQGNDNARFPLKGFRSLQKLQLLRHLAQNREICHQADLFLIQHISRDLLCRLHIRDPELLLLREHIHSKTAVDVGGCRDHRNRSREVGKLSRQLIGPADMAGEQRNRKNALFIHNHHRRVFSLIRHKGRNAPDGDARRSDKQQSILTFKHFLRPVMKRSRQWRKPGAFRIFCQSRTLHLDAFPAQKLAHGPVQSASPLGEADDCQFHFVASRNSVVKAGL